MKKVFTFLVMCFLAGCAWGDDQKSEGGSDLKFDCEWIVDSVYYEGDTFSEPKTLWHKRKGCNFVYGDEYRLPGNPGVEYVPIVGTPGPDKYLISKHCKNRICVLCHRQERMVRICKYNKILNEYGRLDSIANANKKEN